MQDYLCSYICIGNGLFNNVYGRSGSYVTAGEKDYAERMNQIEAQKEEYYKQLGVAPGVPIEKGAYGDPENTGVGYNTVITNLGDHTVPEGWVQIPKHNDTPNIELGAPISWNDPTTPMTRRLVMDIFQTTPQKRRPSSITVTTSAQRLISPMTRVTSPNMMLTCRMASYLSMNIVVARTCHTSSTAKRWILRQACIIMVQDT